MTNQGLFMSIVSNILPKITLSLIFIISAVAYADEESQKDRFAALKAAPEGEVPVIKMDDIKAGKYSPKQAGQATKTEAKTTKKEKASPSPKRYKPVPKKVVKKPKKVVKKRAKKRAKKITVRAVRKTTTTPVTKVSVKQTVRRTNSNADILSAYKALMGTTTKKTASAASSKMPLSRNNRTVGWLYLGKFKQGQRVNKRNQTLGLNTELPRIGQSYTIQLYSNIRSGYPLKGGMPSVVKVLNKGNKVRVLAVHNSRQSGHYWAKIAW